MVQVQVRPGNHFIFRETRNPGSGAALPTSITISTAVINQSQVLVFDGGIVLDSGQGSSSNIESCEGKIVLVFASFTYPWLSSPVYLGLLGRYGQ